MATMFVFGYPTLGMHDWVINSNTKELVIKLN